MSLTLKEENFVVIDIGSYITKAGIGTQDTNKPPSTFVNMADYNNPIKNNNIVSWEDLEASWQHILFKELGIKKARNEHPVLFTVPVHWNKLEHERLTQIAFEYLNVPGLYIAPQPLMALYGCGSVTGLVVDIGHNTTDINVVVDSILQPSSNMTIHIGGNILNQYLLQLLQGDNNLVQQCEQAGVKLDEEFATFIREKCDICYVAMGHELQETASTTDESNLAGGIAAATSEEITDNETTVEEEEDNKDIPENVEIEYQGHKFTIGPYRHKVYDPLFKPDLMGIDTLSLRNAMFLAVNNCEPPEIRPKLWENIVLTGGCGQMRGLQKRVKADLGHVLSISENAGDTQTRLVGFLRIPDYFTVLKNKEFQQYSTWLGAEIVAKLVFTDAKNYVSKVDYNESGPSVCHTKSY
ncbi:actin family [Halteromyces radiatus]|uniref:actin family n=1 Tax=Halteromyces radiatus TaxID=101107 RepID=UPI002220B7E3|nr:actin family [Halteromyces radiatus]KAI8090018.1 actin family [Halteromyces radiatus]